MHLKQNSLGQSPVFIIKTSFSRSSCLWLKGSESILVNRRNLLANLQLPPTPRHLTVTMRYKLWWSACKVFMFKHLTGFMENSAVIKNLTFSYKLFKFKSDVCFFSLSSGLLVAQKVKRKSSLAKAQRRRMPQKRSLIKRRRLAARMETAQQRVRLQRKVCGGWNLWTPQSAYISHKQLALLQTWNGAALHVPWCRLHT